MSDKRDPPMTPVTTTVDRSTFAALSKKRRQESQAKASPAASAENRDGSVSAENDKNATLFFDVISYKKYARKPAQGIPLDEGTLHKKLGMYLTPLGHARDGWYNDGRGNKFFMNEKDAHKNLKTSHMGMYLLTTARVSSYQRNVDDGHEFLPKPLDPDFRTAFECHVNHFARKNKLPLVTISSNDSYLQLYKKYMRGFHTYTEVNMQLSRVACRVAIVRLGLDPELGKWCDDNDTIRIVTHAEANVAFNSDQDNPRVLLLQAMLMEWLEAHGVDLDPQQALMDYSLWPGNENVGVQAHEDAEVSEAYIARKLIDLPETAKGTTKDSRSRRIIQTACLSDDEAEDDDIPSDLPNYKTHYLVENRDDKVAAFESIIHSHGNLELQYSTTANINDYRLLPAKNHIACVLDRYKEIEEYLAKALKTNDNDPIADPESEAFPPSSKRHKPNNNGTKEDDTGNHQDDHSFNPDENDEDDFEDHNLSPASN